MRDLAGRIARAHADPVDIALADDWAIVSGVPCQHVALPYPWATTGRLLALPGPAAADAVTEVTAWLRARSTHWSLLVPLADETLFAGFRRWELMPVLALRGQPVSHPGAPVRIVPARNPDEFLVPYGAELAPLVTGAHLAAERMHHLVAWVDDEPVGCARVRMLADTAYVGAVTVLPEWRGRGLGTALTLAASELGARRSDLVWLHCGDASRALYERIGYRHVDDHVLLVPGDRPHARN
jgi:GNAT superfamily N-acetyltransferase